MLGEKEGGGGRREEEEEEWKGPGGRDSSIVSLHAPVPAVIPALCLSLSTGDVWLLGTVARGWKLKGQRIFQTSALQWAAIQEKKEKKKKNYSTVFIQQASSSVWAVMLRLTDGQRDGWMSLQAVMEEVIRSCA